MRRTQLPFLASALAMVGGLYLLAGPFRTERSDFGRLLAVWPVLLAYEFLVIGAIALLRRRNADTGALTVVSLFFLLDPVFLGDAFASTSLRLGLGVNAAAFALALAKGWLLLRAGRTILPRWGKTWAAAALGFVHLFPSLIAFPASRAGGMEPYVWVSLCGGCALAIPLARRGKLGMALVAGVLIHLAASGIVGGVRPRIEYIAPPLAAAAVIAPSLLWRVVLASSAALASPLRAWAFVWPPGLDHAGVALVVAAFALLGLGLWRNWRRPPAVNPRPSAGTSPGLSRSAGGTC